MIVIALAAGILGLILSVALRRDTKRARSWDRSDGIVDERFVYLSIPGVSLLLLGFGIFGLVSPLMGSESGTAIMGVIATVLAGILIIVGLVLSVMGLFGSKVPTWALPKWRR